MHCPNCRQDINGNISSFQGVMVCTTCSTIAKRLLEKVERDLDHLRIMARDAIRVALTEGSVHLPLPPPDESEAEREARADQRRDQREGVLAALVRHHTGVTRG